MMDDGASRKNTQTSHISRKEWSNITESAKYSIKAYFHCLRLLFYRWDGTNYSNFLQMRMEPVFFFPEARVLLFHIIKLNQLVLIM